MARKNHLSIILTKSSKSIECLLTHFRISQNKAVDEASRDKAKTFKSIVLRNNGNLKFGIMELPTAAWCALIKECVLNDFYSNRHTDILKGGNVKNAEPEPIGYDARRGDVLYNNGKFNVEYRFEQTGLLINNDLYI